MMMHLAEFVARPLTILASRKPRACSRNAAYCLVDALKSNLLSGTKAERIYKDAWSQSLIEITHSTLGVR